MSKRKNIFILLCSVLSASLLTSAFTALLVIRVSRQTQFRVLGSIIQSITEAQPELMQPLFAALKEYKNHPVTPSGDNILVTFGYQPSDFLQPSPPNGVMFAVIGFIFGGLLFLWIVWYRRKQQVLRIRALVDYLEHVNTGSDGQLFPVEEDEFSKLQDETYKTVTMLYQTREMAVAAKKNFADNLSNIAHQLKTPITSISLSTQMMREHSWGEYPQQIERQLARLTYLEEALLLLSRIDAGALPLERQAVDVFTILMLAADNLEAAARRSKVAVDIPELGEMEISVDLEWTMEAVMNLMKNCIEHTCPGGTVHSSYAQNPLYTEILIWDEGQGFAKEEIPHLFERFYRGSNAKEGGIGIGLSLAREIIERQNGMIRARNLPGGGACFEIRFYCH